MSDEKTSIEELAAKVDTTLNSYHENIEAGATIDIDYINQIDGEARNNIRTVLQRISNDLDGKDTQTQNFCNEIMEWVNLNKLVPSTEDVTAYINGPRQTLEAISMGLMPDQAIDKAPFATALYTLDTELHRFEETALPVKQLFKMQFQEKLDILKTMIPPNSEYAGTDLNVIYTTLLESDQQLDQFLNTLATRANSSKHEELIQMLP